jgi:hypothetical protein
MLNRTVRLALLCQQDDVTEQVTITFFVPCLFFNFIPHVLSVSEVVPRNPPIVTVQPDCFTCWCPDSYFDDSDALQVNLQIEELTRLYRNFDCGLSKTSDLFLSYQSIEHCCYGLRCNVTLRHRTACVTLLPLIVLQSMMHDNIVLQPIKEVPKIFGQDIEERGVLFHSGSLGSPIVIKAGQKMILSRISVSCAFCMTLQGYTSSPVLDLSRERRTMIKLNSDQGFLIMEVNVVDVGTQLQACLKQAIFPTPIIIANNLDTIVSAYHITSQFPFVIEPHVTSISHLMNRLLILRFTFRSSHRKVCLSH